MADTTGTAKSRSGAHDEPLAWPFRDVEQAAGRRLYLAKGGRGAPEPGIHELVYAFMPEQAGAVSVDPQDVAQRLRQHHNGIAGGEPVADLFMNGNVDKWVLPRRHGLSRVSP